jgi:centriolar protein POC1
VLKIDFHPYNPILISASADSKVKLWDLRKGCLAYNIMAHDSGATCCKFSHHGDYFATGGCDNVINIWKTNFLDTKK